MTAAQAALLRWSGCTANASGFADMLGDDVAGREAMLAQRQNWAKLLAARARHHVIGQKRVTASVCLMQNHPGAWTRNLGCKSRVALVTVDVEFVLVE
ncbi:hypothetical protein QFZ89_005368 [Paraburkholderia youngii]